MSHHEPICGGQSKTRKPGKEEVELAKNMKKHIEAHTNDKYEVFELVNLRTQVVAGTNYFMKIRTSGEHNDDDDAECIHVRVFKPLPGGGEPQVASAQKGKSIKDELTYF